MKKVDVPGIRYTKRYKAVRMEKPNLDSFYEDIYIIVEIHYV